MSNTANQQMIWRLAIPLLALLPFAVAFTTSSFQTVSYVAGVIVPQYALCPAYSCFKDGRHLGGLFRGIYTLGTWLLILVLYWWITAKCSLKRAAVIFLVVWITVMLIAHGLLWLSGSRFILDTI